MGFFGETFINRTYLATYLCILLFVVLAILLYKTKFGLRLRACGENPQAADSLGINVYKMRYIGTTISGALAGMGGFVYSLTTANCTSNGDVAGFGFLALAVMIFGNWKPLNIAGASLLFGLFSASPPVIPALISTAMGLFPGRHWHQRPFLPDAPIFDHADCFGLYLKIPVPPRQRAFLTTRAHDNPANTSPAHRRRVSLPSS